MLLSTYHFLLVACSNHKVTIFHALLPTSYYFFTHGPS